MIGKLLGNRYEILEQLGGGGMAIVYKGRDTVLNRLVTIKVLRPEFTSDDDFVYRFRREAQAIASLSHPNIVSIYDVGRADAVDYLVMEYVEGDNLKNLIRSQGALPSDKAIQIARQVSDALKHAHENNIVHRDVKPQNILITSGGRAKLTDFGIARGATAATLTQTDSIVGSVHYLSPEQAQGGNVGPQSDIYSLGIVLYEMVTGVLPFQGDTPISVALKHIQEEPINPSSLNPAVNLRLEKIINRAMAKNKSERYETAGQMVRELEGMLNENLDESKRNAEVDDEFATRLIPTVRRATAEGSQSVRDRFKKKSQTWIWVVLIILGLLGAGTAVFHFLLNVDEIVIPSVIGETCEEAQSILKGKGLKNIQVTWNNHPTVPVNRVISQDPPANEKVKVNRIVTINVSKGVEQKTVPRVIGYSLSEAIAIINQSGLNVADTVKEKYSNEYRQGLVIEQDPKDGLSLAKAAPVSLTVSKGPPLRQVPDLVGKTLEQARAELEKIKLKLDDNINRSTSTDYFTGQVITQNPVKGTDVKEGSAVQVTLSDGPGPDERIAKVEARIQDDDQEHELRIVVTDARGTNEAYKGTHKSKSKKVITKEIPYFGKAVIQAYIDGKLISEKEFE
ncbi:MAG: Stk1 family PASTA domain-containing Ser/Thr kinase [Desulfotomaculaceae bacterium]|nr:Stk1 family PASTA domain-containing Ser/Thr kinase [Desulfotomaculaceae bacterium]